MKIMIAVDESIHSQRAVEFVTRMRWPAGSRVIVATVVRPALPAWPSAGGLEPGSLTALDASERPQVLVASACDRLRAAGLPTETHVVVGDAREQLPRLIDEQRADLLVMGSHGRTGLTQLVLGSVSSHVVAHSRCSVLVIKHTPEAEGADRADRHRSR